MISEAKNELKRADHLIFVSLKYTRTTDVLASIIKRLISSMDFCVDELLKYLIKSKKIKEIPLLNKLKVEVLRDNFKKDKEIQEFLKFYSFLIRVDKAEHHGKSEFRKGVALIAVDNIGDLIDEINVEKLKNYYLRTIAYVDYIGEYLENKK